jgi:hypothetical protein
MERYSGRSGRVPYLTIRMTFGTKRCPLEGAILLFVQVGENFRRWYEGKNGGMYGIKHRHI